MTPWYIKAEDLYGDQLLMLAKLSEAPLWADSDEDCFGYLWNSLGCYTEKEMLEHDAAEVSYPEAMELTLELTTLTKSQVTKVININIKVD